MPAMSLQLVTNHTDGPLEFEKAFVAQRSDSIRRRLRLPLVAMSATVFSAIMRACLNASGFMVRLGDYQIAIFKSSEDMG